MRSESCLLEIFLKPVNDSRVSKIEQMENELRKLSQAELSQIRAWLDDLLEDELELTPEFEAAIERSERDMAEGKPTRVRESVDGGEGKDYASTNCRLASAPKD